MNPRDIQNFLMASAAFFSMKEPMRAQRTNALSMASGRLLRIAPVSDAAALSGVATMVSIAGVGARNA